MPDWNAMFAGADYVFGREPSQFLTAHAGLLPSRARALCVAEGEGRNATWLALQGCKVTAFDVAPNGLAKARRLAEDVGVALDLHQASLEDWDWSQRFDLVVAVFLQFVPPEGQQALFANLRRAMAPKGRLFLHGYTPAQVPLKTGGPGIAAHMYSEAMLRAAFTDLHILRLAEYEMVLDEGPGHSGRSALIDLIADAPT